MTVRILVTLGVRATDPVLLAVAGDDVVIDVAFPDRVYRACNRIGGVHQDQAQLDHAWQRQLRAQLDRDEAPSMSVDDTIAVIDRQTGTPLHTYVCRPLGWLHHNHTNDTIHDHDSRDANDE